MKTTILLLLGMLFISGHQEKNVNKKITSQNTSTVFRNKGHELVYKMSQKTGNYNQLKTLKNVVYTYTYRTSDGTEDVSTEKYIFEGELSFGHYLKHERNLPELNGEITQGFNGKEFWLLHENKYLLDEETLDKIAFTRKTNFFWFTMMQKLLDPGINYEYLKEEKINQTIYDIVKITYQKPKGELSDTYHLYINRNTSLIDQFLFTVVDHHVVDKPLLMQVKYEAFENIMIPTYRRYTKSTWEGEVLNNSWVEEICTDIEFNQGIQKGEFNINN